MDPMIEEIKKSTKHVPGFLRDAEAVLLFKLAKSCTGKGVIVEIGSYKGKSTIWLAKGSQAGHRVKVYAIDPHERDRWTFGEFKKNIFEAGIADLVVPLVATSKRAALDFADPVEMIFIDGDHQYESVQRDFELWFPKVIEGGVMAFHDTTGFEGPKRVVAERIYRSRNFRDASFVYSTTFAKKVKENTVRQRLRNRLALSAQSSAFLVLKVVGSFVRGASNAVRYGRRQARSST
jgi:predicted O-methyltransferase YrrM